MSNASQSFLAGGGPKAVKFANVGDTVSGTIIKEPTVEQQRDIDSGKPRTYDDGNPMLQMVVTLQTDLRDDAEDDGVRRLFVRSGLRTAVQKAVQDAGVDSLDVGGELNDVTHTGLDGRKKLYRATYVPPKPGAAFLADSAPVVSTATGEAVVHQQAVPVPAAAAQPAGLPEGVTPEALKALQELGMLK